MDKKTLFIKYHSKQIILLLVTVVVSIGFKIWLEENNFQKQKGVVRGESIVQYLNEDEKLTEITKYQNKIGLILRQFIKQRSQFEAPHQGWLLLINQTKYQILSMGVPQEYKELHVKLVNILDSEKLAVIASDMDGLKNVEQQWDELLEQYFWINDK